MFRGTFALEDSKPMTEARCRNLPRVPIEARAPAPPTHLRRPPVVPAYLPRRQFAIAHPCGGVGRGSSECARTAPALGEATPTATAYALCSRQRHARSMPPASNERQSKYYKQPCSRERGVFCHGPVRPPKHGGNKRARDLPVRLNLHDTATVPHDLCSVTHR